MVDLDTLFLRHAGRFSLISPAPQKTVNLYIHIVTEGVAQISGTGVEIIILSYSTQCVYKFTYCCCVGGLRADYRCRPLSLRHGALLSLYVWKHCIVISPRDSKFNGNVTRKAMYFLFWAFLGVLIEQSLQKTILKYALSYIV